MPERDGVSGLIAWESLAGRTIANLQQCLPNLPYDEEGNNRLGPNLHNILGRKAGSLLRYNYSSAMKDADFVWDEEKLERFIAHPDEVVPGNNMKPYGGLASAEDRAKVVAPAISNGCPTVTRQPTKRCRCFALSGLPGGLYRINRLRQQISDLNLSRIYPRPFKL